MKTSILAGWHRPQRAAALAALALALAACATEVDRQRASLAPVAAAQTGSRATLANPVHVESSSRYGRDLPAGSTWELAGTIDQGRVYRRLDGILTIEGAQVHEAWLVVDSGQVVGFYLPVEQAYSPARERVAADFQEGLDKGGK